MQNEKKPLTAPNNVEYTVLTENVQADNIFATRDTGNQKIEITDLFTHFTASIIQENVSFTR